MTARPLDVKFSLSRTNQFRRDFKRELKGKYRNKITGEFSTLVEQLLAGTPLPANFYDHSLSGKWSGYRECHFAPDLLLIYLRKDEELELELTRFGSHSELF